MIVCGFCKVRFFILLSDANSKWTLKPPRHTHAIRDFSVQSLFFMSRPMFCFIMSTKLFSQQRREEKYQELSSKPVFFMSRRRNWSSVCFFFGSELCLRLVIVSACAHSMTPGQESIEMYVSCAFSFSPIHANSMRKKKNKSPAVHVFLPLLFRGSL